VEVKIYGNKPKKLFIITKNIIEIKIRVIPMFAGFLIKIKNSE